METKAATTHQKTISQVESLLDTSILRFSNDIHKSTAFKMAYEDFKCNLKSRLSPALEQRGHLTNPYDLIPNIITKEEDLNKSNSIVLFGLDFSDCTLENYNFDDKILINVSFRNSKLINCRFRNTCIYFCDLRYSDINGGTFEKADIWWCDLYRSYFQGVIRFANSSIADTSINNTYFSGATLIRKMNFKNKSLLQNSPRVYKKFLLLWDAIRDHSDKIKTNDNLSGESKINEIVQKRKEELELIYKNLTSTFTTNGFSNDSNWAYVQGKKAEFCVLWKNLSWKKCCSKEIGKQMKILGKISANGISYIAFGYGESLIKICCTYLFIVLLFTLAYIYEWSIPGIVRAFLISFKNMVGASDELPLDDNIFLSVLNVLQTTIGILITGIFGFILGNKIRYQ